MKARIRVTDFKHFGTLDRGDVLASKKWNAHRTVIKRGADWIALHVPQRLGWVHVVCSTLPRDVRLVRRVGSA